MTYSSDLATIVASNAVMTVRSIHVLKKMDSGYARESMVNMINRWREESISLLIIGDRVNDNFLGLVVSMLNEKYGNRNVEFGSLREFLDTVDAWYQA